MIPPEAIHAAAEAINSGLPGGLLLDEPVARRAAQRALEAAEQAWPHQPPKRDPASTTDASTTIRNTPRRAPATAFGFTRDILLNGATAAEDTRDERWRDAQS